MGRVFANGSGDLGSIPGRVIPKTLKMVLDTFLLNTQQYKVRIKGKVEQSRERSCALPYTYVVPIEKGAFWSPSTTIANFTLLTQFNCQKHFYFKLFKQLYGTIQLSANTVLMSKNSSIWNNSVKHKHAV